MFCTIQSAAAPVVAGWTCSWPDSFDEMLICAAPRLMPLWGMLQGATPGYLEHEELLLEVTVGLPGGRASPPDGQPGAPPRQAGSDSGAGEGACAAAEAERLGPLAGSGRLTLATPIIR